LFAFSCTSDFNALATELKIDESTHDTILDSGASRHFCPDRSRFQSYQPIDRDIKTADGQTLKAIGTGNVQINLLNGNKTTPVCKGNLTDLRRILHLSLAKGNLK
jgi:hypothetical protein